MRLCNVHVRLRRVVEVNGGRDRFGKRPPGAEHPFAGTPVHLGVREHHRDGSVQPKGRLREVLEDVEVVHAIRLRHCLARRVFRLLEGQRRRALGDAVDVLGVGKGDVERERGGSVRARVGVRVERFAPRLALGWGVALVLEFEQRSTVEHRRLVAPDADGDAERRVRHDDVHVWVFGEKHRARPVAILAARRELNVSELGRR